MAASLCPLSLTPIMDEDGVPVVGARIRFFDAGTSTPRATYRDNLLGNAYDPNDIRTNASGRIPPIWIDGNPYRVQITKPAGALIEDIDGIPVASGGGGGTTPTPDTAVETGDIIWSYRTGARIGWVRPNGKTIGSPTSGATERANNDCEALFKHLWDADANLEVTGGRGANAASDWSANKTIALPSVAGRSIIAVDTLGAPTAGRLTGTTFATGSATVLGSTGGTATATLSVAQLPSFTVTGTAASAGGHTHTGTTNAAGAFTPAGTVKVSYPPHLYYRPTGTAGSGSTAPLVFSLVSETNTDPPADQTFSLVGTAVAAHTHPFTTASAGSHTHALSTDPIGSNEAHQNMPPFILMSAYIRL